MSLLIFAIIVVIVVALLIWAADSVPTTPQLHTILRVAIILVGVLVILNKAGLV